MINKRSLFFDEHKSITVVLQIQSNEYIAIISFFKKYLQTQRAPLGFEFESKK